MKKGRICIALGLLLLAAALFLTGYNLLEGSRAQRRAAAAVQALEQKLPEAVPELSQWQQYPELELPVVTVEGLDYVGLLELPALGLELPVLDRWSYPALRQAPCRYQGTAYRSGFVIAGHNYPAHFGPLRNLRPGDDVFFTDMDGNRFAYQVVAVEVLPPTAVEEMTDAGWELTLFTCTPGGQSRVAVRCLRAET